VGYTVTDKSGAAHCLTLPLHGAVLSFSEHPRPGFRALAGLSGSGTGLDALLRQAELSVEHYDARVAGRSPPRSARFSAVNSLAPFPLSAANESTDQTANHTEAIPADLVLGQKVHFKLPMPAKWNDLPAPSWFHALVEIREAPSHHGDSLAPYGEWQVTLPAAQSHGPRAPALACFSAAIQWGGAAKKNVSDAGGHASETIHPGSSTNHSTSPETSTNNTLETISSNLTASIAESTMLESGATRRLSTDRAPRTSVMASVASFVQASLDWLQLSDFASPTDDAREDERTARRRLEDTYGASLVHVNRIYNKEFGAEGRKVPAHVPHMIDREYMDEMQARWAQQWAATSSHRFRSSTDMQYSFSYYYYLMNRHKIHPHDLHKYLSMVADTDRDGHLDENEFRSVATMVKSSASPTPEDLRRLRECISNSSTFRPVHAEEVSHAVPRGRVRKSFALELHPSIEEVLNCTEVVDGLRKYINWNNIFPSHVQESDKDLVAFEMIGDNFTIALSQLDSVRARQSKFICINDNMKNPTPELEKALRSFYESFFPEPCLFELPPGASNPTLYLDKYLELRRLRSSGMRPLFDAVHAAWNKATAWGWKVTRNALLSMAHETIDAVSDYEAAAPDEELVHGLRNEIRREPHRPHPRRHGDDESGLGRTVLYLSVIGMVGIVLLRVVGKPRRN
jgi:hypothetical protein